MLEEDLAELGIDVFAFGGSVIRKIAVLAERNGFDLPADNETLLGLLNKVINAYGKVSRPAHEARDYIAQETTKGRDELEIEGEVFYGKKASARSQRIRAA